MRGQIIKRGETYLLRVYVGRVDGKRRYLNKTFRGTHTEAKKALTAMLGQSDRDQLQRPSGMTLKDYLENWLRSKLSTSTRTLHDYRVRLETDVIPTLGHLKLHEVTATKVKELYATLVKKYSPATLRYTHAVLRHALQTAVDEELLVKNPAAKVEIPKVPRRPITVLTPEQIRQVFEKAKGDALYALWTLLLGAGFRPGEALAFKWGDLVKEQDGSVSIVIQRTLVGDGHGNHSIVENEAKTEAGLRKTLLPPTVVEAINRHRTRQVEASVLNGVRTEFIFASATGGPLDPANVRNRWKSLLKRLELPNVRLYDTRHSHATALLTQGVPVEFIANRLGHKSATTAQKYYMKFLPQTQTVAANAMEVVAGGKA